jgi:UDP-GlcNAc3NAcA epimerase
VASLHFAPTRAAAENLRAEGVSAGVHLVGDVMYDAALHYAARLGPPPPGSSDSGEVLVTVHRAENTDDPARLGTIVDALCRIGAATPATLPLHPRTRAAIADAGLLDRLARHVRLQEPLGYLDMIAALRAAPLVVTDSGGVQKEAFFFRTPCVTMRPETEWVELVELGWNRLASPDSADAIVTAFENAISDVRPAEPPPGLYGGGHAAGRIAALLLETAAPTGG